MQPYNPYSPPVAPFDASTPQTMRLAYRPVHGMWLKWAYLGVTATQAVAQFVVATQTNVILLGLIGLLHLGLLVGWLTVTCMWIHSAWNAIPPEFRRGVDPGSAVGRLFIPFYNLVWAFAISTGLADALNVQLASIGSAPRASKGLAVLGCILHVSASVRAIPDFALLGAFLWIASAAVWFTYMTQCDRARMIVAQNTLES